MTLLKTHQAADQAIALKLGLQRSPAWNKVAKTFLKTHPDCVVCGANTQLNVHHIYPFHFVVLAGRPDLELDPRNLMTLCVNPDNAHHLLLGHLDDYVSYNEKVAAFGKTYAGKTSAEIRATAAWKIARTARPKHWDQMTPQAKAGFRRKLDRKFKPVATIAVQAMLARNIFAGKPA